MNNKSGSELALEIRNRHFTPQSGLHCTCGQIVQVFSEGFPVCAKAVEEYAEAINGLKNLVVANETAHKHYKSCADNCENHVDELESTNAHLQKVVEEQKGEIERLKEGLANPVKLHMHILRTLSSEQIHHLLGDYAQSQLAEQKAEIERLKKAEKCLDDQLAIHLAEPSIKTDAYMAGLANGMLLAKANFGGDYNPISYKDSRLAEQTERVRVLTGALEDFDTYYHEEITNLEFACASGIRIDPDQLAHYRQRLKVARQALNQDSLGDGGKGE